jgi:arylsulfatase A-like enzyme
LRADRLGCYGYERDTTPALDRFASTRAVRFAHAFAESSWTLPSHVTLLSGLHPLTHGVRQPDAAPAAEVALLAERLAPTHYTFAITDGGWLAEPWGFARGFASFTAREQDVHAAAEEVNAYLRHRADKGPWLAFWHTYDVHCPYDPPAPWAGRYASAEAVPIDVAGRCGNPDFNAAGVTPGEARFLSDRYDEDVRRVDDALGRVFAQLDALDLWDSTIVIVTSDHGEEFLEHGQIGHERTLSREALAVPLLVHAPGIAPRVAREPVGLADAVPTVLELVGLAPAQLDGRSLVPLMRGGDPGRPPWVLSDLAWQVELVARTAADEQQVLDLAAPEPPARAAELLAARARLLASGYKPLPVDPGASADELRALGYR